MALLTTVIVAVFLLLDLGKYDLLNGPAWALIVRQLFLNSWPWQISPLMARVFAGWYFLAGVILVFGYSLRQAHEIPIAFGTLIAWSVLALSLPLMYSSSLRIGTGLWLWLGLHSLILLQTAWATAKALGLMKKERQVL